MGTRAENIITRARDTLADPQAQRWSNDRLLRLLDEGQLDIAKHSRILKGEADINPQTGSAMQELPADVWMLTRAAFKGCEIPFHSHDEMDELIRTRVVNQADDNYHRNGSTTSDFGLANYCWELEEGADIQALIYDRRNMSEIQFFPIPKPTRNYQFDPNVFGVTTGVDTDFHILPIFGAGTGFQSDVEEFTLDIDPFGVVTGGDVFEGLVHIWYIKTPRPITALDSELDIPPMWDVALKHYITSHAFDDDYDTKFIEKAAKAWVMYTREIEVIAKTDAQDGIRKSQYRTDYRGAFE